MRVFDLAGAEGLEPSARGFGGDIFSLRHLRRNSRGKLYSHDPMRFRGVLMCVVKYFHKNLIYLIFGVSFLQNGSRNRG